MTAPAVTAPAPTPTVPAVWLNAAEAAAHVGVSWPTLRQILLDHRIPHRRVGRRWIIEAATLDEHLRRLAREQVA